MSLKSASAASWLAKQQQQSADTTSSSGQPIHFDLLEAKAAAVDLLADPRSRQAKKRCNRIIEICTGETFREMRSFAAAAAAPRDAGEREDCAKRIIAALSPYTQPGERKNNADS